ncbi:L,L-diaminopimelate aminotransferase [Chlamydia abortus]|uniref:cysteine-S-conjugate beta-lyase n=1 Tax=Paenibacillus residui TaxID=629724 RepID=A0ABW3DIG9_9BACL|nr:MalY/PatB family protein [Paenibacillus sp. 32O-W]SHE14982.1 L,L-diaminopimelate aminotransferase [Chlamydia abortus]
MVKYNFDQVINRIGTACSKWDEAEKLFGYPDILPMWVADMDFESPPEVKEALIRRAEHGVYGYTIRPQSYYDAIIGWQQRRHGWSLKQDWICSSPGVVTSLGMLIEVLTRPGDRIMLQVPIYPPFYDIITLNDRVIVRNPLKIEDGSYKMDFELMERQMAEEQVKMLLLCNPHNPVGRVWTKEELHTLGQLCLKYNVIVLSDEVHGDIIYRGHRHTPFASLSEAFAQQSVTCIAPSKTFNIAGLQSSSAIIPNPEWRRLFKRKQRSLALQSENYFAVAAVECCYNYGEAWLDQLLEYLAENVETVLRYVEKELPEIKAYRPEGTYLVWLDCRNISPQASVLKDLMFRQARVAFSEGSGFGAEGEGYLRVNIACPRSLLLEGLERFTRAVRGRTN